MFRQHSQHRGLWDDTNAQEQLPTSRFLHSQAIPATCAMTYVITQSYLTFASIRYARFCGFR